MIISGVINAAPDGKKLFDKHCTACHGSKGAGGVGVPLSLPSFIDSVSDEYLEKTIRLGRPGRIMPAFSKLSDAQVKAIAGYMRSWSDAPAIEHNPVQVKGDKNHGKELYLQHCAQCHGEDGQGGKGTGVTFSRKRDLPIIAPALNNPGFLASATDTMIKNTLIYGREGTPMTSSLVAGLEEEDIDDVVSYIRSLQKIEFASVDNENDDESIIVDSPYGLDETLANLKQAITDQNFTIIRTDYLDHGLVDEGKENRKRIVLHFCNFRFLFDALAIDPRIGIFLPCRVTVVEHMGKVQVMTINPLRLSKLFNNEELNNACKEMTHIYETILEDTVL